MEFSPLGHGYNNLSVLSIPPLCCCAYRELNNKFHKLNDSFNKVLIRPELIFFFILGLQ